MQKRILLNKNEIKDIASNGINEFNKIPLFDKEQRISKIESLINEVQNKIYNNIHNIEVLCKNDSSCRIKAQTVKDILIQ